MGDRHDTTTLPMHRSGDAVAPDGPSRRALLGVAGGLLAGAAMDLRPRPAAAQSAADAELARVQAARRILLKGGVVLTLDSQVGDFAGADVLIEDGKIREIRPDVAVSGETAAIVDASNRILIPGFVDTHSHSYQGLLRGILASGVLVPDYNRDVQTTLTPAYAPADVYAGVLATALGMIEMGTTGVVDISQISHTPEHSDACIRALEDSGIRAVFAFHRGAGPAAQYPQDIGRLQRTYFSSKDQLLTLALASPVNAKIIGVAREAGVPAVVHLVDKGSSEQFIEHGRAGLLRPGDEFIHCLNLSDDAWRLIKDGGGNVSVCAAVDMAMGHGTPAIQEALDHGLRPSLSSDHGVTIAQDFFSVMRATFALQHMLHFQRVRAGDQNPPALVTCRDMLEFATVAGARCGNLDHKIGTLTPGKDADVVMLRTDRPSIWPLNNAAGAVVNLMTPADVDTVLIAGKARKWRGSLVGVDMARFLRQVEEARDAVMRRAGYRLNVLG